MRKPRDQFFKKSDIDRLLKSAKQIAPDRPYRIAITRSGDLMLIVGEAGKAATADDNDLDNWMAKHHAD